MNATTPDVKPTAARTNRKIAVKKITAATPNITALVVESRAAQGLPPTVQDEAALRQIASLLARDTRTARRPRRLA
jgi:hypothetical protein